MMLEHLPPLGRRVLTAAYPDYRGRKWAVVRESGPVPVVSSWDGGSRDRFVFVRLADYAVLPVPTNGNPYVGTLPDVEIPTGCVLVEHSIFCGKDMGITFHVRDDEAIALLPPVAAALPWTQLVVLTATASLKSSYAGIPDYRRHEARRETGIADAEYSTAKAALIDSGHLNRAGAITPKGRNALPAFGNLYKLRRNPREEICDTV